MASQPARKPQALPPPTPGQVAAARALARMIVKQELRRRETQET